MDLGGVCHCYLSARRPSQPWTPPTRHAPAGVAAGESDQIQADRTGVSFATLRDICPLATRSHALQAVGQRDFSKRSGASFNARDTTNAMTHEKIRPFAKANCPSGGTSSGNTCLHARAGRRVSAELPANGRRLRQMASGTRSSPGHRRARYRQTPVEEVSSAVAVAGCAHSAATRTSGRGSSRWPGS